MQTPWSAPMNRGDKCEILLYILEVTQTWMIEWWGVTTGIWKISPLFNCWLNASEELNAWNVIEGDRTMEQDVMAWNEVKWKVSLGCEARKKNETSTWLRLPRNYLISALVKWQFGTLDWVLKPRPKRPWQKFALFSIPPPPQKAILITQGKIGIDFKSKICN